MEVGYRPEAWHDLFSAAVGASAGLTGLLFVAVSIHLDGIARNPALRYRASFSLYSLVVILLVSAAMIGPPVPRALLGTAVAGCGLPAMGRSLVTFATFARTRDWTRGSVIRTPLSLTLWGAWIYGGATFAIGRGGGLVVIAPLMGALTVWALYNAWELVIAAASRES